MNHFEDEHFDGKCPTCQQPCLLCRVCELEEKLAQMERKLERLRSETYGAIYQQGAGR